MCADLEKGALQCFAYTRKENHRALKLNRIHHIEMNIHSNLSNPQSLFQNHTSIILGVFFLCKIKYLYNSFFLKLKCYKYGRLIMICS